MTQLVQGSAIERIELRMGKRRYLTAFAVFIVALVAIVGLMPRHPTVFDEGIILTSAMRVLEGEIPHRDFYSNYGPGQPYSVALVFAVFGTEILPARVFGAAIMALCAALGFLVVSAQVRPLLALFTAGTVILWLLGTVQYLYPIFPCLALLLLSALFLLRQNALEEKWPIFLAGMCAGVSALFRYDTGFFTLLVQVLFIAFALVRATGFLDRIRRSFWPVVLVGIGSAIAFFPFAISFLLVAPLSAFTRDIIEISGVYREMRGLPFPNLGEVISAPTRIGIYFPFLMVVIGGLEIWRQQQSTSVSRSTVAYEATYRLLFLLWLFTAIMIYKGVVRVSVLHFLLPIVPGALLAGVVAGQWMRRSQVAKFASFGLLGFAFICSAGMTKVQVGKAVSAPSQTTAAWLLGAADDRTACPVGQPVRLSDEYASISRFLKAVVPSGERILIGLNRHDKIFVNPMILYPASNRLPATKWAQYDPGVQTSLAIQSEMIDELEEQSVRWIVRDASFERAAEPNGSAISSGVFALDDYIAENFQQVAATQSIEVWLRIGEAAPPITIDDACMPELVGQG